jgi:hypothetical protein
MKKNNSIKIFAGALAFLTTGMAVGGAQAGRLLGEFRPELHGEIEVETQFNRVYSVDKRQPGTHNTNIYSECDDCIFRLGLFPELAIILNIGAGPEREELDKENVLYQDMEMFAEEFYIQYSSSNLVRSDFIDEIGFFAGKFNPVFGLVNGGLRSEFEFPGIFSEEFPEQYELKEMLGVGAETTLTDRYWGEHTLRASIFYKDNSFLQSAFPAYRERNRVSKGGIANTGSPQSFSINLSGEDLPIGGLKYELGFRHLKKATQYAEGARNIAKHDDVGVSVGLIYNKAFFLPRPAFRYPLDMKAMFEYAHFNNFNGIANANRSDRDYYTATLQGKYGPWLLAFIYSRQDIHVPWDKDQLEAFEEDFDDEAEVNKSVGDDLYEVNLGYRFNSNWLLQGSWALTEEYEDQKAKEQGVFAVELDYQIVF